MQYIWIILVALSLGFVSCTDDQNMVVSQKYIHKYGFEVDEEEWTERDQDGTIETVLDNGIRALQNFENGKLNGKSTYTFPYSSTIEKLYVYDMGELLKELIHDRNGIPIQENAYEYDKRKVVTHWDIHGAPMRIEEYENGLLTQGTYYNPNNEIEAKVENGNGSRIKRSREGLLLLKDEMVDGKLTTRTTFHPNKVVHMISHFDDYLLQGKQEIYTPEGHMYMVNHWDQGVLNGLKISFRKGKKIIEVPYVLGKIEGIEKRYGENGELVSEIAYSENEKHGEAIYYDEWNPDSAWFYKGHLVSEKKFEMLQNRDELIAQMDD